MRHVARSRRRRQKLHRRRRQRHSRRPAAARPRAAAACQERAAPQHLSHGRAARWRRKSAAPASSSSAAPSRPTEATRGAGGPWCRRSCHFPFSWASLTSAERRSSSASSRRADSRSSRAATVSVTEPAKKVPTHARRRGGAPLARRAARWREDVTRAVLAVARALLSSTRSKRPHARVSGRVGQLGVNLGRRGTSLAIDDLMIWRSRRLSWASSFFDSFTSRVVRSRGFEVACDARKAACWIFSTRASIVKGCARAATRRRRRRSAS